MKRKKGGYYLSFLDRCHDRDAHFQRKRGIFPLSSDGGFIITPVIEKI
mgnify:CR=1 FL=1|jgi:hypothetical protein